MEQTSNFNMRDNIERKQKVITVVKRIYLRLSRLLKHVGMENKKAKPEFKRHAKNFCFLASALPRAIFSVELQHDVIRLILVPLHDRMKHQGDNSFAPELLIGARWLNWVPGINVAEKGMQESTNLLKQVEYDPEQMDDANFSSCTNVLVNYFILSLVSRNVREPSYWLKEGLRILGDRWVDEVDIDLCLMGPKKIIREDDMNMAYFVTHVVFMANDFGNICFREKLTK